MPVTVDTVNSSDTLNQGRVKWNANDAALASQGNSLEAQQAAHVGEGHPVLYYTKAEVDAIAGDGSVSAGDIIGSGPGKAVDGSSIGLNASNELEVKLLGIVNGMLAGGIPIEKLEFKIFAAILNQAGTNPPAATVIKNTLGVLPIWVRNSTGIYFAYAPNCFPANKTLVFVQSDGQIHCGAHQSDNPNPNTEIDLNVKDYTTDAYQDGWGSVSFLVLVFP